MSEDAHNPDGSPPSFVPAEIRAEWWERKAKELKAECHHWAEKCGRYVDKWNAADRLRNQRDIELKAEREAYKAGYAAERARSAKLVALLKSIGMRPSQYGPHTAAVARELIAEYEASRD